jgi:hypothetical protein
MAITYYAGNRLTGVSGDTKPTSNVLTGTTFLETNTDDLYIWDGDSWNIVASDTGAQTFTNKTFTDAITFKEMSAPGNQADTYGALYVKAKSSSNAVYFKADDETEYDLTESASAGSLAGMSDTTITSPSDAALLLYDTGTSSWRDADMSGVATIDDVGAMTLATASITGQSAETTPQGASDFILMYDNSASALKKITVSNLLAGGVSADTLSLLNDTTIASVASAQVLIYDGSDSWDNKTVSGDISINTSGVAAIGSGVILNADVNASAAIAVSKLAASTITIGGTSTTLGGTITALTALTDLDLTSGDKTLFDTVGNNTLTIGASTTTVNIAGDLTVSGDATTFNTATVSVEDPLMILASNNNAADAVDIGFYGLYDTSGSQDLYSGLFRDANDSGKWKLFKDLQAAPTTTVNTSGTGYAVGTLVANVEGNITGSAGTATGLAGSATQLATARTIGGTSFDGTANIVPATTTALATGRTIGMTGDVTWTSASFDGSGNVTGTAAIAAGVIVNADVNSGAGIVDTKLATISTADKVAGGAIQIDSGTDGTGITIADTDKLLIDDAGATKYINASQIKTYAASTGASESFAIAMAVAL